MKDIEPITKKYYNCWVSNIATLSHYFKRSYNAIFINNLYFPHNIFSEAQSHTINNLSCSLVQLKMLKEFHGIEISEFHPCPLSKNIQFPLLINVDAFYLPWTKHYQAKHLVTHCIIAQDKKQDQYSCVDPFFSSSSLLEVRLDTIQDFTYCNIKCHETKDTACFQKTLRSVVKEYAHLYEEELIKVDTASSLSIDTSKRENSSTVYDNAVILKIDEIINNRYCYAELMEYLDLKISPEIFKVVKLWEKFKLVIISKFLKGETDTYTVKKLFEQCIEHEMLLVRFILSILKSEGFE